MHLLLLYYQPPYIVISHGKQLNRALRQENLVYLSILKYILILLYYWSPHIVHTRNTLAIKQIKAELHVIYIYIYIYLYMHVIIYVSTVHRILFYLFTFTTRIIRSKLFKHLRVIKEPRLDSTRSCILLLLNTLFHILWLAQPGLLTFTIITWTRLRVTSANNSCAMLHFLHCILSYLMLLSQPA